MHLVPKPTPLDLNEGNQSRPVSRSSRRRRPVAGIAGKHSPASDPQSQGDRRLHRRRVGCLWPFLWPVAVPELGDVRAVCVYFWPAAGVAGHLRVPNRSLSAVPVGHAPGLHHENYRNQLAGVSLPAMRRPMARPRANMPGDMRFLKAASGAPPPVLALATRRAHSPRTRHPIINHKLLPPGKVASTLVV